MDDDNLQSLASQVRKGLHWSVFLFACMAAIMIIDLQLKKAVARQAVVASKLYTDLVMRYGGPAPGTPAAPGADGDSGSSVGGDAGLAAPTGDSQGAAADQEDAGVDGQAHRAPRNGRRTGGPR